MANSVASGAVSMSSSIAETIDLIDVTDPKITHNVGDLNVVLTGAIVAGVSPDLDAVYIVKDRAVSVGATLDLTGLFNAQGAALDLDDRKIWIVHITCPLTNTTFVNFEGLSAPAHALCGLAYDITVFPGGAFLWYSPHTTTVTVVATTTDLINITGADSADTFSMMLGCGPVLGAGGLPTAT